MSIMFPGNPFVGMAQRFGDHFHRHAFTCQPCSVGPAQVVKTDGFEPCRFAGRLHWPYLMRDAPSLSIGMRENQFVPTLPTIG